MNKAVRIFSVVLIIIAAFVLGYFTPTLLAARNMQNRLVAIEAVVGKDAVAPCQNTNSQDMPACLEGVLYAVARANHISVACDLIQEVGRRKKCADMMGVAPTLDQRVMAFCKSYEDDPFCLDLAKIYFSQKGGYAAGCQAVENGDLQNLCFSMIRPQGIANAQVPSAPVDTSKPPKSSFGLVCPEGQNECDQYQDAFIAAVLSKDGGQCSNVGSFQDFCRNEVALYQSYTGKDFAPCLERNNEAVCQYDKILFAALDAADADLCIKLTGDPEQQSCRNTVDGAAGEKRFDYLQK